MKKILGVLVFVLSISACGGGMYTKGPAGPEDHSYNTPWGDAVITKDAFILGSDFPSDLVIPDIDGMRDTAFVVSYSSPSGVLAIDLDKDPLQVSSSFKGLILPDGSGFPNRLHIVSRERGFLITSSHIIDFNPVSGEVRGLFYLLDEIDLGKEMPLSDRFDVDGDGDKEVSLRRFKPSFPSDIVSYGDYLYVSLSDYVNAVSPAVAAPGIVKRYKMLDVPPYLEEAGYIVTSFYNPVGLTPLKDGLLAVTDGGVTDIWDGEAHPITEGGIDIVDTYNFEVLDTIPMGMTAPSFGRIALTSDGRKGYIGSRAFSDVYEIDFESRTLTFGREDAIRLSDSPSDFVSSLVVTYDDSHLFAASFDLSTIFPIDLRGTTPRLFSNEFQGPFVIGFPKGVTAENPTGGTTGIGKIVARPGVPGVDFGGPDLFAITGSPGTIVTINTHGGKKGSVAPIEEMTILPDDPVPSKDLTIQLFLSVKFAGGRIVDGSDKITNPYSGYPMQVIWESSDSRIASVDAGLVRIHKDGEVVIRARIAQKAAEKVLEISTQSGEEIPNNNYIPPEAQKIRDLYRDVRRIRLYIDPDLIRSIGGIGSGSGGGDGGNVEILRHPPQGADPFADAVVSFQPGEGAGFGMDRFPDVVLGPPHGAGDMAGSLDVLSLGYKGEIILEMKDFWIADGDGPDFIVFENVFYAGGNPSAPFSEPAIVGVSEDGVNFSYFRYFDCDLTSPPFYPGCAGTKPTYSNPSNGIDPTDPSVAGGNAFDLRDVGLKEARFVKIIDGGVTKGGSGGTVGFDLDAVSVVNGVVPH